MNEKNRKERKAAKIAFIIQFSYVLLLFLLFGICTLITARKGISTLEEKKALYDDIFRKQADYNFRMDDMFRNMNSLSTKERSGNEHRQLQLIITQERDKMLDEIKLQGIVEVHLITASEGKLPVFYEKHGFEKEKM